MIYQRKSVLITGPTEDVLTVQELKVMLGITSDADDALLAIQRDAVTAQLDPAKGGWLGRALRPQTWELRLSQFPADCIKLPFPTVTELTSVKYDDQGGTEQTLTVDTDYRVFNLEQHTSATIAPPYNDMWPIARSDVESVRIRYVAGYSGDAMPKAIKQAIALGVQHLRGVGGGGGNLYLRREEIPGVLSQEWTVSEAAGEVIRKSMESLLSTYRVWG